MRTVALVALLGSLLVSIGPAGAQDQQTVWTIAVDCTAGQSINQALAQAAPVLTIDVRGLCEEEVVIRRDNVTLRGTDPSRDGIRSISETGRSAVTIRSARQVQIENLRLAGGLRDGLHVSDSTDSIRVTNCLFEGNDIWGASISDSSVEFVDTVFTGNAAFAGGAIGGGLIAARGSNVLCTNCVIEINPEPGANLGAVAFSGSTLRLEQSRVSGDTAALAQDHSRVIVEATELTGATWAFQANSYGTVRINEGEFFGPFLSMTYSTIELFAATQSFNPLQNFLTDSSKLISEPLLTSGVGTTLTGLTLMADYSTGRLTAGTVIEELTCRLGGDILCEGTQPRSVADGCSSCRR